MNYYKLGLGLDGGMAVDLPPPKNGKNAEEGAISGGGADQ
jgi:hypothetical protein